MVNLKEQSIWDEACNQIETLTKQLEEEKAKTAKLEKSNNILKKSVRCKYSEVVIINSDEELLADHARINELLEAYEELTSGLRVELKDYKLTNKLLENNLTITKRLYLKSEIMNELLLKRVAQAVPCDSKFEAYLDSLSKKTMRNYDIKKAKETTKEDSEEKISLTVVKGPLASLFQWGSK